MDRVVFGEFATLTFFVFTGYKFKPTIVAYSSKCLQNAKLIAENDAEDQTGSRTGEDTIVAY